MSLFVCNEITESKSVKLETSNSVILPPIVSVLWRTITDVTYFCIQLHLAEFWALQNRNVILHYLIWMRSAEESCLCFNRVGRNIKQDKNKLFGNVAKRINY